MRWLHVRVEAPLVSFGGEAIDALGVTRNFPAQSMVTGLFANALGWDRWMGREHQRLQDRLVVGAIHDKDPTTLRTIDYQTAKLAKTDRGWSTRGRPIGRAGGPNTYLGAHQRHREYLADLRMSLVMRLRLETEEPTLDMLAAALQRPARPLFIGRKPCLPTAMLFGGWLDHPDIVVALRSVAPVGKRCMAQWPEAEGPGQAGAVKTITDERNWISGLHGGARLVRSGILESMEGEK